MRIVERYILKEFVFSLLYCIIAFIFLYILGDLFNYIDEMIRNSITVKLALIYYATFAPTIFVQTAPWAVLLATIYTLSNFRKNNELTAMRVSGISLWKIIKPIVFTSAILSIAVFFVNEKLIPEFMPLSSEIRNEKIREIGSERRIILNNIAVFGEDNRIIYARQFNIETNELSNVIVHTNNENQSLVRTLSAEKGKWIDGNWVFTSGTSYRLDELGRIIGSPQPFSRKVMDLKETPKDFLRKNRRLEFMSYGQLRDYIDRFSATASATKTKLLVDLYRKTSLPFICLVVIFVAAPVAFMIHKGGLMIGIGISMLIGLAFFSVEAFILAMGKAGILPPLVSAWAANILFLIAGYFLMKRCR